MLFLSDLVVYRRQAFKGSRTVFLPDHFSASRFPGVHTALQRARSFMSGL